MTGGDDYLRTAVGATTADSITIAGRDLPTELMGHLSLTELAYLFLVGREPSEGERRLVDAVLVSLADHGHTPSSLATRLTYTGAPEALQAAVAAGLIGAGSVFLGPAGDTAIFLADGVRSAGLEASSDAASFERAAERAVRGRIDAGERVPGLGHPVHRDGDPRTPRLFELARIEGLLGPHLRLLEAVGAAHAAATGKTLPVNGAGAGGAALADAGIPAPVVRGVVLIARTAGLVAHLAEEMADPIGKRLWLEVEERARDER